MNDHQKLRLLQVTAQITDQLAAENTNNAGAAETISARKDDVLTVLEHLMKQPAATQQIAIHHSVLGIAKMLSEPKPALETQAVSEGQPIAGSEVIRPLITADSATYAYDSLGRLTSVTFANTDKVVYHYDAVGNRTSVVSTL